MFHSRPFCPSEGDTDEPQFMGDASKEELSEEEQDAYSAKRGEAMSAMAEGEWQKAIDLVSEKTGLSGRGVHQFTTA